MRYQFGPFRLDTEILVLFRGEDPIYITPKALQTLRVLVENSGRVVSKRELLTCVWGEVNVEETNLTQNIFALRRILERRRAIIVSSPPSPVRDIDLSRR